MDETTFQQELVRLQNRVSQMSFSSHFAPALAPAASTSRPSRDAFGDQLHDVKVQIESMQTSLNCLHALRSQHAFAPPAPARPAPQNQLSQPSGPLFWQLFSTLRTDVRSLDGRVADLEQNVSDIEDRVDKLGPAQCTPPESESDSVPLPPSPECADGTLPSSGHNWSADLEPSSRVPASESVAFRDREIAQLEELMRGTQADLTRHETLVTQRDIHITQLTSQRDSFRLRAMHLERACSESERTIAEYRRNVDEKGRQVENLQAERQASHVALGQWSAKYYAMQQAFTEQQEHIRVTNQQILQLQHSLREMHSSHEDELNRISAFKDEETGNLRDLFEAKERVVCEQEKIIGRGAAIIQERDHEIERLTHELNVTKDDLINEARGKDMFAKLIEERDDEMAVFRMSTADYPVWKKNNKVLPDPSSLSPFAYAPNVFGKTRSSWTPTPFDNHVELPHERMRASVWATKDTNVTKFGTPSEISLPADRGSSEIKQREVRRSNSLQLLEKLTPPIEGIDYWTGHSAVDIDSNPKPRQSIRRLVARAKPASCTRGDDVVSDNVQQPPPDPTTRPHPPSRQSTSRPLVRPARAEPASRPRVDDVTSDNPQQLPSDPTARLHPPPQQSMRRLVTRGKPDYRTQVDDVMSDNPRPVSRPHSIAELPQRSLQAYVEEWGNGGEC